MLRTTLKSLLLGAMFLCSTLPTLASPMEAEPLDVQTKRLSPQEQLVKFKEVIDLAGNPHHLLQFLEENPNAFFNFYTRSDEQAKPIDNDLLYAFVKEKFPSKSFSLSMEVIATLGDFATLSSDIIGLIQKEIWENDSGLACASVSRGMFTMITGLPREEIPTKTNLKLMFQADFPGKDDLENLLMSKPGLRDKTFLGSGGVLSIGRDFLRCMPTYVWKGCVRNLDALNFNVHKALWPFIKDIHLHTLCFTKLPVCDTDIVNLVLNLHGTKVKVLDLSSQNIGAANARYLCKYLLGTNVRKLNLSYNKIGLKGIIDLTKNLQGTNVHTLGLCFTVFNAESSFSSGKGLIGAESIRDLELQGTKVRNLDFSYNLIGAEGAKNLKLQGTSVHAIDLGFNKMGDEGVKAFAQNLQGTSVHTVNVRCNNIGDQREQYLQKTYPHIKWIF